MREIEVKVRIHDKAELLKKLEKKGISLADPLTQHDRVFGQPGKEDNEYGANWLRIRTENTTTHYFTLKKSVVGHLDSIEHETVIENPKELEKLILELGFTLYSDLTKVRQKGHAGDLEICVDDVPGLGTFIEAEKLEGHDSDHDAVTAELWEFLSSLGLRKDDEVFEGYDVLERRQRGL